MANSPEAQIGSRIRQLRRRAKLSISSLAELADLDVSFVNNVELGKRNPALGTLVKLAKALDVELTDMLSDLDLPKAPVDYVVSQHIRALLMGRNAAVRADILAILKGLHNREDVRALKRLITK